ncbi:uncharacterized protein EAE98_011005 [Botrytis deweyae]|uniref:Heterokaryon incompatibility domain-containing protein n=1 Tax=Botrytis deweyae TaxID=2478750 RepID=A0ABQ7I726_9HELO|nr:uncharacterized protein EAE98_011005 [Botrytis deweyae]KAF7915662.1 hypothetical protein EAE98_011005 [Botrytis deweyae]
MNNRRRDRTKETVLVHNTGHAAYSLDISRHGNGHMLKRYERRSQGQKRQRVLVEVVHNPAISGVTTSLQISLNCITGYFKQWRQLNSRTVPTMQMSEHAGIPTVSTRRTSNRSSFNLRSVLNTSLDPHSAALPLKPTAEFYQPLDRSSDQIRLLERVTICPESTSCHNLPTFKLVVKSLSAHPEYSALSYAWGEDLSLSCIVIDGIRVEVRANLVNALVHIRPITSFLWIDALCINQDDVNERNHQVMQMGSIYKQATEVIVWLGDKTDQGFGKDVETLIPDVGLLSIKNLAALQKDPASKLSKTDIADGIDELLLGAELVSLGELCGRPYWNRLWIVQEVLLAKDLAICWSNEHSPGLRTVAWAEWS